VKKILLGLPYKNIAVVGHCCNVSFQRFPARRDSKWKRKCLNKSRRGNQNNTISREKLIPSCVAFLFMFMSQMMNLLGTYERIPNAVPIWCSLKVRGNDIFLRRENFYLSLWYIGYRDRKRLKQQRRHNNKVVPARVSNTNLNGTALQEENEQ